MLDEAMSIEVERISEAQRFTTRLLSERAQEPPEQLATGRAITATGTEGRR